MSDVQQIIEQIAAKIGTTAEAAWPLYVQYIWADGLTGVVLGSIALIALSVVGTKALKWQLAKKDLNGDDLLFMGLVGVVLFVGPMIGCCAAIGTSLPRALAPAGAAIHDVVVKATR